MRGIIDFYRRNPIVLVAALLIGLVVSLLAAQGDSESIVSEILAVGVVGLMLGLFIAWRRSRGTDL